jgi:hypothetical protein
MPWTRWAPVYEGKAMAGTIGLVSGHDIERTSSFTPTSAAGPLKYSTRFG